MALYKYSYREDNGEFHAYVETEGGQVVWRVSYPDYYEHEEDGELIESNTLFDDGYMKDVDDVEGLEDYLKSIGVLQHGDELYTEEEWEEHYEEEYADGGMMDVRMEDTVQRMDDPNFADISFYAKGGNLETKIKNLLVQKESFDLPLEMAVYVPSTEKANQIISKREFAKRIEDVQVYLSQLFGGFSSVDVEGGYESSEKGLIQEDVTKVVAFGNRDGFEDKFNRLMNKIVDWCKAWSQESIGFEFEGDLFYISENAKFSYGGGIDDDEAMQRKMILKSSRSINKPQPEYYRGYDKRHYKDEKPYSPIKYDDMSLEKFLKSKYNKRK
jgi:hypothetical protein